MNRQPFNGFSRTSLIACPAVINGGSIEESRGELLEDVIARCGIPGWRTELWHIDSDRNPSYIVVPGLFFLIFFLVLSFGSTGPRGMHVVDTLSLTLCANPPPGSGFYLAFALRTFEVFAFR